MSILDPAVSGEISASGLSRPRLSLAANFSWTLAGNLVFALCQWGLLVVLARLGNPEAVGRFTLAFAVTAPAFMFANLQLRAVQATDAKGLYGFGDYLGLRALTTAATVSVLVALAAARPWPRETALTMVAVIAAKAFESFSDVCYGWRQRNEQMDRIGVSLMLRGILSLGAFAAVFYVTRSVVWSAAALAGAWLTVLLACDARGVARELGRSHPDPRLRLRWATLARLAWLALPLGVVMMIISLNSNLPRYAIVHFLGERNLGLFSALAYVTAGGGTIVDALGQAATPSLANAFADGDRRAFRRTLLRLMGVAGLLGAGGVALASIAGRPFLAVFYGSDYAARGDVFIWLMAASAAGYLASSLGYAVTATRYFVAQAPLFLAVTAATALGCWLLIPIHGLAGAAMVLLASAGLQFAGSAGMLGHAVVRLPRPRGKGRAA
ncbi:MAG: lipopolysaccharide biosynthesis protein [Acidobacteria bacterium]|nr:lipopolysaccharide biosynthesis protein [Acidobacteriota bacterium]